MKHFRLLYLTAKILAIILGFSGFFRATSQTSESSERWEVSGVVTYDGRPVKGAFVTASGPERVRSVATDGHGNFVLSGKTAGQYSIGVVEREGLPDTGTRTLSIPAAGRIQHVDFLVSKGGVISGQVLDKNKQPVAGLHVEAMIKAMTRNGVVLKNKGDAITDDRGEYRLSHLADGVYVVTASPRLNQPVARTSDPPKHVSAAYSMVTFHPNGQSLGSAVPVEVHSGQEQPGTDIVVEKLSAYCITFRFDEAAKLEGDFKLDVEIRPLLGALGVVSHDSGHPTLQLGVDYEICGVSPGDYKIEAGATRIISAQGRNTLDVAGYATEAVTVDKKDVNLGTIALQPGLDVLGKVLLKDSGSEATPPPGVRVALLRNGIPIIMARFLEAEVQPSGVFSIKNVLPDEYELQVRRLPKGYYLVRASQQGKNVIKGGLRPGSGDVEIVLGSDGAILRGRVLTDRGESGISNAVVVLVPKNGEPAITTRTDQDGGYEFASAVAPGEYQLAALVGLYEPEQNDPEIAAHFRINGADLTLGPRESLNLDLKAQAVR